MRTLKTIAALFVAAVVTVSVAACYGSTLPADDESSPAARISDLHFTGVWVAVGSFGNPLGPAPWSNTPWPSQPPFTEWGAAESRRLADIRNVVPCQPGGPIFVMWELGLFPIQILEAPDQIVIQAENVALPRRIYMDGRGHPDDLEPTWMGHSIGRWDGEVLVVDTIGTNGRTRAINGVGSNAQASSEDRNPRLPVSDQLHLVERLRLVADGEMLEDEMTITDPKIYTAPFTVRHYWQRRPDLDVMEYYCGDSPRPQDETNLPAAVKR